MAHVFLVLLTGVLAVLCTAKQGAGSVTLPLAFPPQS